MSGEKPVATCVGWVVTRRLARVPSVDAHLLATDALSETPFPPPPAFPPPCGPAIAAVALVLMCSGASRPRALLQKFRNRPGFRRLATRDPERRDDESCLARSRVSVSHESSDRGVRAIRASREVGRAPRSPPCTRKKAVLSRESRKSRPTEDLGHASSAPSFPGAQSTSYPFLGSRTLDLCSTKILHRRGM